MNIERKLGIIDGYKVDQQAAVAEDKKPAIEEAVFIGNVGVPLVDDPWSNPDDHNEKSPFWGE